MQQLNTISGLVSVIIPAYNHAEYLSVAIESVKAQSYKHVEIVIVDDGSTDETRKVAQQYPEVIYHYQQNQGLATARNEGISRSAGEYLVFLDADDWLVPDAIALNLKSIGQDEEVAFVSGAYELYFVLQHKKVPVKQRLFASPYCHLLERNFIGMHAAVLFRRWVFNYFQYDKDLPCCEDYDLLFKIVRQYSMIYHDNVIAVYRMHESNMSKDCRKMLRCSLEVLNRQQNNLRSALEKKWFAKGQKFWRDYYGSMIVGNLVERYHEERASIQPASFLGAYLQPVGALIQAASYFRKHLASDPGYGPLYSSRNQLVFKFLRKLSGKSFYMLKQKFKKTLLKFFSSPKTSSPAVNRIDFGDFMRLVPFSKHFGYDRGGPLDRYYIEKFLFDQATCIRGRILEIGDNEYTLKYGREAVLQSDVFHVDASNPKATFVGDLSNAPQIPSDLFDCIVLTQTLHLIYDYSAVINTCHRILKPGGTLLITVPGISNIAYDEWGKLWQWSFTKNSLTLALSAFFKDADMTLFTYGNALVAAGFLYGVGVGEIKKDMLDHHDEHYQVIIAVSAQKSQTG